MKKTNELELDAELTEDQQKVVSRLSEVDLAAIDQALLESSDKQWRKVARIVAAAMRATERISGELPDVFYSQRVRQLVDSGDLEARDDLRRMRFSEVRRIL